ncbi:23S rRNA pseudouridine2605 synthase [Neorhizobium sp. R1-B]|uniref:pseudouridine synthase n=1 Tax=Neorhizobium sp. R1-B TaxID=2485162 RepID=UPI001066354E|nr:pseudouridine synthase [Neorhizobium sp. R1-B]TDX88781.1 23S rRNA pseudouridine2605 synthase [Neorhizobium sp. R1-B]
MNSKDKPKRGEGRTFVRETKPRSAPKAAPADKAGAKKKFAQNAVQEKPAKAARRPAPIATVSAGAEGKAERISKILARAGVASRRDVERMIMEGRVSLNGKVLETPVVNVTLDDKIEVDGVPIRGIERTRLWLYHKPAGLVTTNSDPEGRPTVFDNLPEGLPRVMSIGRLDINTEGLLLLTNDGGLSRVLELPTTGWLRRYRVRAHGEIDQEALDKLKEGIAVDGVLYGSIDATLDRSQGRNVWITMGLREGKNREIKNVLGALGLEVNRLIRISYGPFQLGDLPESEVIEVRGRMLRDQLGPRLIDESKANFDAPIYNDREAEDEKPARTERSDWAEKPEKTERPRFGKTEDRREKALGRLDTKPGDRKFGDKPRGKGGAKSNDRDFGEERPKKRPPMGTSRTANVWMAPGARPTADGKGTRTSARAEAEQLFKKPAPENDRRVVVKRAEEDSDWIRADAPAKPEKDDFGRKRSSGDRSFGDRPPRGDRPFGDKPRGDRKPRAEGEGRSERPRGERTFGDRPPRGDRSFDKPKGDRFFGDRPRGDRKPREDGDRPARPFASEGRSERPRGERSFGDRPARSERPAGDRPFGDKPRSGKPGGKSFGGKPGGGKGFGGKPAGGRAKPGGSKPGGRPGGARPGGKPRTPRG